jgi:uncharacterized protein (DUF58 family)
MIAQLYLSSRFFLACGALIALFLLSFAVEPLFPLAQIAFVALLALTLLEGWLLFGRHRAVECRRTLPNVFSLNDLNPVTLTLSNPSPFPLWVSLIDELPYQLQIRDFSYQLYLTPGKEHTLRYELTPKERGEYAFGAVNLYLSTPLGLLQRRRRTESEGMTVPVFPSVIQMKQLELRAFSRISHQQGIKKIRRIGHSYEFEQIKNYVPGDDYRSLNWKASSRRATLMVNQYEDERAQQVYCLIDKSRVMRMPFQGLTLMEYAINASLAISNIVLRKYDRAGLITFSDKLGAAVKADSRPSQLRKILHALYNEKERHLEADYELLFQLTRRLIHGRSLLLLFTNFESMYALERVMPILRRINRGHLLVVIFFENTEIRAAAEAPAKTLEEIYRQTVARKFLNEKERMAQMLRQYGIQSVLTRPEDLSISTINKYLELKSRGLI